SVAQALFVESAVVGALGILNAGRLRLADGALLAAGHEIPLIDQDNHRTSTLMGIACDVGVEAAGAFGGVDHEEHDVGVFDVFARHDYRKLLRHQPRFAFAADAGGINEANLAAFVLDDFIDGIARSAGDRRDDGAIGSRELIQQRGFADVRVPDDRDLDFMRLLGSWCAFLCALPSNLSVLCVWLFDSRQHKKDRVEQIVNAASMLGRNRKHVPHSQGMKFAEQRILLVGVHLVDGEEERLAGARQKSRQLAIGTCDLGARIDDHDDGRGFFERNLGLAEDFRGYEVFVIGDDAAGIYNPKVVPTPFDLAIEAVAGNAGLVSDNGAPRSGQMVEERRLADVGAADDGDEWEGLLFLAQSD